MKKRKYRSEFAINMNLTHTMVLQQDDLKRVNEFNYFNEEHPCHTYFICRRPRILVDPTGFSFDKDRVTFKFRTQNQDSYTDFFITVKNDFNSENLRFESNYPYNYFEFFVENEKHLWGKSGVLLQQFGYKYAKHMDLEILYIGQSYGVDGARTSPDRLKNHSTLQGIYSEAITRNPDFEIWLILTSFEQILLTNMDGRLKITDSEEKNDTKHLMNVTKTFFNEGLNEQQVINFTEAALIRYFEPKYNIEYKKTFPNPAHSTYRQCYDLDINSVCVELNTESINFRIFSPTVPKQWIHMKAFALHSRKDRKDIFDLEL